MKQLVRQLISYFREVDKASFICSTLLVGLFVFLNYHFHLDGLIGRHNFTERFIYRLLIFGPAFSIPYLLSFLFTGNKIQYNRIFLALILIAPVIFSFRMALNFPIHFSADPLLNRYWYNVFYWPIRLLIVMVILFVIWRCIDRDQPFYGMSIRQFNWRPYAIMLLIMLPLIALASTQADFLHTYPKLQQVTPAGTSLSPGRTILFELAYGTDFFSIELFFRGFLVLAFIKWAGKAAILPMACFYCTIHFGKPLGECISSFPGGLILGVVVYYTRSIWGGLMVHLGIAWLMEAAGYFHPFV